MDEVKNCEGANPGTQTECYIISSQVHESKLVTFNRSLIRTLEYLPVQYGLLAHPGC